MDVDKNSLLDPMDISDIFRTIFNACDVENTNSVPVSKLIEFIKPYLMEDLNALEDLKHSLDPTGTNSPVSSQQFYEVMGHWSEKIVSTSSSPTPDVHNDFDRSPSKLNRLDIAELPYTHSTPRASLGDKLLNCKELLNLSNTSGYSLSTSRLEPESDKTALEEEVKKLEHQLLKTTNELARAKEQLAVFEDQNEQLQNDLQKVNRRLHDEQQAKEHLQMDVKINEDLQEEVNNYKKHLEMLKKKLAQSEKDSLYHRNLLKEIELEKVSYEKKVETISLQYQNCLKQLYEVETELKSKEQQLTEMSNEFKLKLSDQKSLISQLKEENELLLHQKSTLEKRMEKPSSCCKSPVCSNLGNYFPDFSKTSSPIIGGRYVSLPPLKQVLTKNTSTPKAASEEAYEGDVDQASSYLGYESNKHCTKEEYISWESQQSCELASQDFNRTTESLKTEMYKANCFNEPSNLTLFERDERIAELEFELEQLGALKANLDKRNDELLEALEVQQRRVQELMEKNFLLITKEESIETKNKMLKQKVKQLEQNGVIVEQESERENAEREEMLNRIRVLEASLKDRESEFQVKSSKLESVKVHLNETFEKMERLELLKADNDEKLQDAMKNLGEMSATNVSLCETIEQLKSEKTDIEEKLSAKEQLLANQQVDLDKLISKSTLLECTRSECNDLSKLMATIKEESVTLKQSRDEYRQLADYKEELLKEAKAKQLEQDDQMKELLDEVGVKSRMLSEAENQISLLSMEIKLLKHEIDCLNEAKTALELEVATLKSEQSNAEIDHSINAMSLEIQEHIKNKNEVIQELKQLNRRLEMNLVTTENDLRRKISDILELRERLVEGLGTKNDLWTQLKAAKKDFHQKISEINQLTEDNQKLQDEYNVLLVIYDLEVAKNAKLLNDVNECTREKEELKIQLDKISSEKSQELLLDVEQAFHQSDQILQELETKLTEEVDKNKNLSKDLLDVKNNYIKTNEELQELKRKLVDNETEMLQKLEKYNEVLLELDRVKRDLTESYAAGEKSEKLLQEFKEKRDKLVKNCRVLSHKLSNAVHELEDAKKALTVELTINLELKEQVESEKSWKNKHNVLLEENNIIKAQLGELGELKTQMENIKLAFAKESEKGAALTEQLNKINSELAKTINDLDEESYRNIRLCQKLEKISTIHESTSNDLSNLKVHLQQTQATLDEKNQKLQDTEQKLVNSEKQLQQVCQQMIETVEQLAVEKSKNDLLNECQKECERLKEKLVIIENEKLQIAWELSATKKELIKLKKDEEAASKSLLDALKEREDLLKKVDICDHQKVILETRLKEESNNNQALLDKICLIETERDTLKLNLEDVTALYTNIQEVFCKKKLELQERSNSFDRMETDLKAISLERDKLKLELQQWKSTNDDTKKKSFSRQELVIEKLKSKLEDLQTKLKSERNLYQIMQENLSKTVAEKDAVISVFEAKLARVEQELERSSGVQLTFAEIGVQVDTFHEPSVGKKVGRFTLTTRSDSPDSPSIDLETIGILPKLQILSFTESNSDVSEVPSLDVIAFADKIVEQLELNDSRKELEQQDLERKVTALILQLVENANSISERIERQTEMYRYQYEAILSLISDISYRLRDHVCIGTKEPIKPVHELLERLKMKLKDLVQNSSQMGVLISEDRMKRCWNLLINYVAVLRQDNEALHNTSRESTPTQTGLIKRKNSSTQDIPTTEPQVVIPARRGRLRRCSKMTIFFVFLICTISIGLLSCRITGAEEYCRLDAVIQRINVGFPPM